MELFALPRCRNVSDLTNDNFFLSIYQLQNGKSMLQKGKKLVMVYLFLCLFRNSLGLSSSTSRNASANLLAFLYPNS